ncbi:MAG: 3-phosphoglycerate dehydrogenase [Bosea sp.]|uniref:NAD(P)-dependent oxidoreductase n=1 Tax=Bosea sp. (in: a-proteobacteria) TaxID=1871050 RepID=UPI002393EF63|nr:3-phosphoglycerate dehydrogenase [Bosea sp. (in: a-proteobacteria)]MCP4733301.1 3-phosphoglycerate dehydrogenase [Bosea sp. (in: a-proteobacteria)]
MIIYVDCSPFMQELLAECEVPAGFRAHLGKPNAQELVELLADATVALDSNTRFEAEVFARCPKLRSIVFLGSGAKNYIDLDTAAAAGVTVHTIKGYGDRSIAEHSFGLALAAARQLATMDRSLRAGHWEPLDGVELKDACFGVVGAGGVGREAARIARDFGMKVLIWNRSPLPDDLAPYAAELDSLLARSDVVSLHLADVPETRGFAGQDFFAAVKKGALFVNTARGALVDDEALIGALASGQVAHAALDVFTTEPLPATSPYLQLANVTLSAHAAFKTRRASSRLLQRGMSLAIEELRRVGKGVPAGGTTASVG